MIAAASAIGHGLLGHATTVASLAWLCVIGVPETVTHLTTFLRCCRDWLRPGTVNRDNYWRNDD